MARGGWYLTRMVSIKDIAADVGVSVSLVSKVLSNKLGTTGVRATVVRSIQRRAVELGYRKNLSAAALRSGRHNVIGVFIHRHGTAGSGIIESFLEGIAAAARASRQKQFLNFFESAADFRDLCKAADRGVMDGLIVGGVMHPELQGLLMRMQRSGLPVVTVCDESMHASLPNIGMDQVEVGRMATQHLIDRGCRRIAHIQNFRSRTEGYRKALLANGIPYRAAWVYIPRIEPSERQFSHVTGEQAVDALLQAGVAFDGFVSQSDQEAMGVINALHRRGMAVPGQVRVIGVDNSPYCEFGSMPLSSVSQSFDERGRRAVDAVLGCIEGRQVPSTNVEPVLVARESSR